MYPYFGVNLTLFSTSLVLQDYHSSSETVGYGFLAQEYFQCMHHIFIIIYSFSVKLVMKHSEICLFPGQHYSV